MGDPPNVPADFLVLANNLGPMVIRKFTTLAVADSALGTKQEGQTVFIIADASWYGWTGSAWVSLSKDDNWIIPTGTIHMWLMGTAPSGFLLLNGALVSRTTYAALFALWGTTFGAGDGSTTFGLPDARARMPVGYTSTDTDYNALGKTGGSKTISHSHSTPNHVHSVPAHSHPLSANGAAAITVNASNPPIRIRRVTTPSWTSNVSQSTSPVGAGDNTASVLGAALVGDTDNSSAVNTPSGGAGTTGTATLANVPPYMAMNFIVKT